jgi:hypothetical protein
LPTQTNRICRIASGRISKMIGKIGEFLSYDVCVCRAVHFLNAEAQRREDAKEQT